MSIEKPPEDLDPSRDEESQKSTTSAPLESTPAGLIPNENKIEVERQIQETKERLEQIGAPNPENLVERLRSRQQYPTKPVIVAEADASLIREVTQDAEQRLEHNHARGFGVFPSGNPQENFYGQVWARDFAHAAGNYFAETNPEALQDSLATLLKYQRPDGALPYRVEREYAAIRVLLPIPGSWRLAKPLFDLVQRKILGRQEKPNYEGDFNGAEDTVPATLVAAGEFFLLSEEGKKFGREHFTQLKKAADFFRHKTDSTDGLAIITHSNPDWAETIQRTGKLGLINVAWARSLRLMAYMADHMGEKEAGKEYRDEFTKVKQSVMSKLYNSEEGYFRAQEGDERLDTCASIFGALYLLDAKEAVRVEENLKKRVTHSSGLTNFDPKYPDDQVLWIPRLFGNGGYHNEFVWPWVTCENIQVKIKIALQHPDEAVRNQYKHEAVEDLIKVSSLFKDAGGAYEVFKPDEQVPAASTFYHPPQNFMANLSAYSGAYLQLKRLGWIDGSLNPDKLEGIPTASLSSTHTSLS